MKTFRFLRRSATVATVLLLCFGVVRQPLAEDIDLYVGGEAATGGQTNVLIVLDNGPNWAANGSDGIKLGKSEMLAIKDLLGTLGDNVNVGLLMGTTQGGGYVRYSIREMGGTSRTAFENLLQYSADYFGNDGENNDKITEGDVKFGGYLNAAFRYFEGLGVFNDRNPTLTDLRDYAGNLNDLNMQPAGNIPVNSLASVAATTYTSPAGVKSGCAKNYIIFIGNGYDKADSPDDLTAAAQLLVHPTSGARLLSDAEIASAVANVPGGDNARWADEWTRFMYTYGAYSTVDDPKSTTTPKARLWNKITTYTINVCQNAANCGANGATPNNNFVPQIDLMKSMAKVGGGKYFLSDNREGIKNALALIFAEIQAVNSVFASATLPVSVNAQGTFENQVYIGEFRPDPGARPRWYGNLKEYKFGRYCDIDGNGQVGIDSQRGLVNGMITSTLDAGSTAKGDVSGTFSANVTAASGVVTPVTGTVTGYVAGTATTTLAATFGASAGTTALPAASLGGGIVTVGTISGTGTGTGTATFTGTLIANPSVGGRQTSTDERIGDDVNIGTECATGIKAGLYLADQNGYRAIDETGNTGFIDASARSYWTSASTFWSSVSNSTAGASDSPDGPEVERGGAAQRLRTRWAETPTGTHPDGRKVYTCLDSCLSAASGNATRTLSSNPMVTTIGGEVALALAAPTGSSATVTLVRAGNTVTATSTAAHGFFTAAEIAAATTKTVTIAGATPTDYNGSKTISYVDATHFTYTLNEAPTDTDTATATKPGGTVNVTSIALSGTTPGATVTATVTTNPAHGLAATNVTTIAGAAQSFLNGPQTVLGAPAPTGTTFAISVTIPGGNPASPAATAGSAVAVGQSATHSSVSYNSTSACVSGTVGCVVVLATANLGNKFVTNNIVVVSGAVPDAYNTGAAGATIRATGTNCPNTASLTIIGTGPSKNSDKVYCYTLAAATAAVTPDTGASMTATSPGTSFPINITRTLGGTTATAVTNPAVAHGFVTTDTISFTGAVQSQYNGSFSPLSVNVPDANTFTFGPISLTPTTPPTGTITATTGTGIAGPDTTNLILWTRGKDLWEDEDINASLTNVRASIHGDVLHSRPVVVNYGSTIGVVGFYGSNDGFLRAVSGGLSVADGAEKWAFIPAEAMDYDRLARLYTNSATIRYPNSSCSVSPPPKAREYVWDGSLSAYQSSDGTPSTPPSKTWLFASMRRGGRALYALDISDPDVPKLMWRISNTKINNTASADYAELGQTWSEPKVIKLLGSTVASCAAGTTVALGCKDTSKVAVAFGAGYDATVEDKPTGSSRVVTMGRGVFVTDAATGARLNLLQSPSGQAYSFAADVTPLDIDSDGYTDRIYAADTGGNIYRFDADPTKTIGTTAYWTRYVVARVGDSDNNGGLNARKFLFGPEVFAFRKSGQLQVGIYVGSGDREKPLANFTSNGCTGSNFKPNTLACPALYSDSYFPPSALCGSSSSSKVNDRFFGIFDTIETGTSEGAAPSPIALGNLLQINDNDPSDSTLTPFALGGSYKGWQIYLRRDPDGNGTRNEEKTVNRGLLTGGTLYFSTNTPQSPDLSRGVCTNLGEACGYAVDPFTGMPKIKRTEVGTVDSRTYEDYCAPFQGGGLPPTATAGFVKVGDETYAYSLGTGGSKPLAYWDTDGDGDVDDEDKKKIDDINKGKGCPPSPLGGCLNDISVSGTRNRLYWSYGSD